MAREYWAAYSVSDHTKQDHPFLADVMLFDRLVVPYPPNDKERVRWADNGWDPDKLERLLGILGEKRVRKIAWDDWHQDIWKNRYKGADRLNRDPFQATRDVLLMDLPAYVTGVQSFVAYPGVKELAEETGLHKIDKRANPAEPLMGAMAALIGRQLLVPAVSQYRSFDEALEKAVAISSDSSYRRKRAAYWRWQNEFVEDCPRLREITRPEEIDEVLKRAVEEMNDLIADEQRAAHMEKGKTAILFCFTVAAATLPLVGGPITALATASACLSVGAFLADKLLLNKEGEPAPSAVVTTAQREFGWHDGGFSAAWSTPGR